MSPSPAIPQNNASLRVSGPTKDTQFHFGNQRLFACVNGDGNLTQLQLAEGIRVLNRMHIDMHSDSNPLRWQEAEAFERCFSLFNTTNQLTVQLTTTCDSSHAVLFQHWSLQNQTDHPINIVIYPHFALDLHRPKYKPFSLTTIGHHLLTGKLANLLFGKRRWKIENRLGEMIKSQPVFEDAPLRATAAGLAAGQELVCSISCDPPPQQVDPQAGSLRQSITLAPQETRTLLWWISLEPALSDPYALYHQAIQENEQLRTNLYGKTALARSLYAASQITAQSMFKRLPSGFCGLWAGPGYAYPPRIYFRDSYWTAQPLIETHPQWVREHILSLALGVHQDGSCPSGVIDPAVFGKTLHDTRDGDLDWMPEHFDSPAFFILLVRDYLRHTQDPELLTSQVRGTTILELLEACAAYYQRKTNPLSGLPHKGQNPNDWADNVIREPLVTYDLGLIYGAWKGLAEILESHPQQKKAHTWSEQAHMLRQRTNKLLWREELGWFADYAEVQNEDHPPFSENHLALDTLTAVHFGLAEKQQSLRMLTAMTRLLFSKNNTEQPYEDFGVLCCYPPYQRQADLFGKSADPYRYHNGAEWPYLSVLLAWELKQHGFPPEEWEYALTRWWQVSLAQGWLTPLEFHSPGYAPGAFLQGWSGLAALVLRLPD